jgi:hypothetical protein
MDDYVAVTQSSFGQYISNLEVPMRKFIIISSVFVFITVMELSGQSYRPRIRELGDAISSGDVTLAANGNGGSSGGAITGSLKNNTSAEIRINAIINNGLYLLNSGAGQNMVATHVFYSSGECAISGANMYISLPPNTGTPIIFFALCADFYRDNPSPSQTFKMVSMPSDIQEISSRISRYLADNLDNLDLNLITSVQVALWHYQGVPRTVIRKKFAFTNSDWELATRVINY